MNILVLGAGGTGGYFGGRLADAGSEVDFLLRPASAARVREHGLVVESLRGDVARPVSVLTVGEITHSYDLILLSCKAYDLDQAMTDIAAAMDRRTLILPLLNGLEHLRKLDARFGALRVLGGMCNISVGRDAGGRVVHFNRYDELYWGSRTIGLHQTQIAAINAEFSHARFRSVLSSNIMQDMWEKFTFITTLAAMTCTMRADVGTIVATDVGKSLMLATLVECQAIAAANGCTGRGAADNLARRAFTEPGSTFTSSMLRDVLARSRTEADHILGNMVALAHRAGVSAPILTTALCHLQVYEYQLARHDAMPIETFLDSSPGCP